MVTITVEDDIFLLSIPNAKEGDVVKVTDMNNIAHYARLELTVAGQFSFSWTDAPVITGRFKKNDNDKWVIITDEQAAPGDKVQVTSRNGTNEEVLGDGAGEENTFYTVRKPHFALNPNGDSPKWCVKAYHSVKEGDIIHVQKKDGPPQKHKVTGKIGDCLYTTQQL